MDLTTVGSLPGFNIGTGLQIAGPDGADLRIAVQMNACVPPVSGGISMTLIEDNMTALATGPLVATVGDSSDPGYLFRGRVTPQGPALPDGVTPEFVAQLSIDRTANTAQLTVAFIDTAPSGTRPAAGASATTTTSTTVPPSS